MSVSKLRESTEKKGCMITVWVVMVLTALSVALGGFYGCFNPGMNEGAQALQAEVMTVDGKPVTLGQVSGQVEAFMGQLGGASDPDLDFQITASVLGAVIDQQLMANMAAERGIVIEEPQVLAGESDRIDDEIREFRLQAVAQSELKETATEAEFQKFFEEKTGETTAEYKSRRLTETQERMKDPAVRRAIFDNYAMQELQKSFFDKATATDEEVRKSFDKLMLLRISFDNQEKSLQERETEANQALAEIKAGGDFLAVQKKYMKNPIKEPASYALSDVERNLQQRPLASLKPGEVSGVITEFGIPSIYKLVEVKSELPADFEANKIVYSETVRREKANADLQKAVDDARKNAKVVWKSKGFETLYEVYKLRLHEGMSEAQAKERLIEIMRDDLAATDDPAGPRIATLARYAAMRQVEPLLTADERKELLEDVSLVLLATLDMYESTQIRMQLVDVYLELGRNSDAAAMLLTVAENNNGFEPQNEETFAQVNLKVTEMETKGQITDAEALAVRDELVRWSQEKKQAEDDAKKAQEELEKFDVDPTTGKPKTTAEKALEEANKTTGGATAGTTATTTGN